MFGFGYAMVPLYEKICAVTGINNLLNPSSVDDIIPAVGRSVRVEFDTNSRTQVSMIPNLRLMKAITPGESYSVIYTIKNLSGRRLVGQAVPSYGPPRAGKWFKKIQCFCFDKLTLEKDETRQSPVVFVIDGKLPEASTALPCHTPFLKWKALNEVVFSRPQCGAVGVFWRPRQKKRR